jgi:hypothetical protein
MIRATDQLLEESDHPHLVTFLRSGGTLEIGEDFSTGAFARLRKGNRIVVVTTACRDFAAILKEMNSLARTNFGQEA